jgi:transcriptional coactivator p15 (PC4)
MTNKNSVKRPGLPEPVIISDFWANRRGESVRVQLREYEGCALIDIRKHFTDKSGKLQATKKGLALVIARLPELAAAINQALAKVHALGLIAAPKGQGHE